MSTTHPRWKEALRRRRAGESLASIAADIGVNPSTVYAWAMEAHVPAPRRPGTTVAGAATEKWLRLGLRDADAAAMVGLSKERVRQIRNRLGLPKVPPALDTRWIREGVRIGDWTVVRCTARIPRSRWVCRCACGSEREMSAKSLARGVAICCGCRWRD